MKKHRVVCIAGARPNFMKIAPVMRALAASDHVEGLVVHTGQHYDAAMSSVFFTELGIPEPHLNLDVGSASHGVQTGRIMIAFEEVFDDLAPDLVLVVGDVNSTIACALVARKRHVPVAHVEAGLRSFDRAMPEEINRVLTDQISDLLFITENSAAENLRNEGVDPARIHFVGNTMIDTLAFMMPKVAESDVLIREGIDSPYAVATFHRPSNVDREDRLTALVQFLERETGRIPFVFPVHPRTRSSLDQFGLLDRLEALPALKMLGPLAYTDFIRVVSRSSFIVTDSGGIQEETTWLGLPCLTQRTSTERPSTEDVGTNTLIGEDFARTSEFITAILDGTYKKGERPELWDGQCAPRIVDVLERFLAQRDD